MAMIYPFMQKLREAPFPAPGNTVEIKSFIPESGTEVRPTPLLQLPDNHRTVLTSTLKTQGSSC